MAYENCIVKGEPNFSSLNFAETQRFECFQSISSPFLQYLG